MASMARSTLVLLVLVGIIVQMSSVMPTAAAARVLDEQPGVGCGGGVKADGTGGAGCSSSNPDGSVGVFKGPNNVGGNIGNTHVTIP